MVSLLLLPQIICIIKMGPLKLGLLWLLLLLLLLLLLYVAAPVTSLTPPRLWNIRGRCHIRRHSGIQMTARVTATPVGSFWRSPEWLALMLRHPTGEESMLHTVRPLRWTLIIVPARRIFLVSAFFIISSLAVARSLLFLSLGLHAPVLNRISHIHEIHTLTI